MTVMREQSARTGPEKTRTPDLETTTPPDQTARHVDGDIPPVRLARSGGPTASACAFEPAEKVNEEDPRARDLKAKVATYVAAEHGGDYRAAFKANAGDDGAIDEDELNSLLKKAKVGLIVRMFAVNTILKKLDGNCDKLIEWFEFEPAFEAGIAAT